MKSKKIKVFDICNYFILSMIAIACVLPFINIIASSFATPAEILNSTFLLFPTTFTLDAYKYIFSTDVIFNSLGVSVFVTFVGTSLSLIATMLLAYGLSRKYLIGRSFFNFMIVFTMLFSGGMIPGFLLVKNLGLIDTYWALIIPGLIDAFNFIIMRNFFQALPESLEESAKIDGANDLTVFFKIYLPLALPSIATIGLFYAVNYWNTYMSAILYINDAAKWPIQILLRQIVIISSGIQSDPTINVVPPAASIKMAVIVVATVPMLLVYPFVQRYFIKGALIGSVKG